MSPPEEQAQVIAHDPEAHKKLDRILDWIEGDQMNGKDGVAATIRHHEATLTDHGSRLERHSARIRALEEQSNTKAKSTLQALSDRALQLLTMVLSGIVGAFVSRFIHH